MVCGRGSGRSQLKSVSGADRARLCGHVKLSFLNSDDYQEYLDRKVGARACATSSAYCSSVLVNPSIQKVRTKIKKKYPKYLPKCSVGSTDYVCNFLHKKILSNVIVEDIDV